MYISIIIGIIMIKYYVIFCFTWQNNMDLVCVGISWYTVCSLCYDWTCIVYVPVLLFYYEFPLHVVHLLQSHSN